MNRLHLKYFVLKPSGNDEYAEASREALKTYANTIKPSNLELAQDLIEWVYAEEEKGLSE